ncbi:relaxase/mobilization nuclease domain-containing protein [Flavobacterium sp. Sd200]|uniref:relaxase/mobilization nuclease domain-containing protein n=1 Tax=Flavobacterium sp. Sd200 TaxID=2692211 RepID=UPI00136B0B0D|nr:relaxase/mobilization nuclease domain-containing protein [Flavobacterium sp. Sd200]MXN91687.1 relaxase/mobilization nuclease domain-containing protein [Flavobacterium sp. Sd200]
MVAVIKASHALSRILRYNEEKISSGAARFLGEGNCPFEGASAGLMPKLNYLEGMATLNARIRHPGVHISLNFPPEEQSLSDSRLLEIARTYMQEVGFATQPWLAYRHMDAGHPHLHIVSLKVRPDGSRIDMHNIGRNQSETARKAIEKSFGLIPAEKHARTLAYKPEPLQAGRLQYGKAPTKKAIANVLQFVLEKYRFCSLPELNALLGLYNIKADRGKVTSRTFLAGGLLYRALDAVGNPLGVPIKASDFHFKPSLARLEVLFTANKPYQDKSRPHLRTVIDSTILKSTPGSVQKLQELLKAKGVDMVLRQNAGGQLYGLTFIDHTTHCVINGSSLGKPYSAKGLSERISGHQREDAHGHQPSVRERPQHPGARDAADTVHKPATNENLINELLSPTAASEYTAAGFNAKRKKKRKGRG